VLIGLGTLVGSLRAWVTRVRILRHGELAWATIRTCEEIKTACRSGACRSAPTGRWLDFREGFDQLDRWWNQPRASSTGSAQKAGVNVFLYVFRTMLVLFAIFGVVIVSFMVGAILSAENLSAGARLLFSLVPLAFLAIWLGMLVLGWRMTGRVMAMMSGEATVADLGCQPMIRCRFEFQTASGQPATAEARVDLTSRLQSRQANPTDVALYDPGNPERALLLSSFTPPLNVSPFGEWQLGEGEVDWERIWAEAERDTNQSSG
jgi:hypothetical protein